MERFQLHPLTSLTYFQVLCWMGLACSSAVAESGQHHWGAVIVKACLLGHTWLDEWWKACVQNMCEGTGQVKLKVKRKTSWCPVLCYYTSEPKIARQRPTSVNDEIVYINKKLSQVAGKVAGKSCLRSRVTLQCRN